MGVRRPPLTLASSTSLAFAAASILSAPPVHIFPASRMYSTPRLAAGPGPSGQPCLLLPLGSSMLDRRHGACSSGDALPCPGPGAPSGGPQGAVLLSSCLSSFFQSGWSPLWRANGGDAAQPSHHRHQRVIECKERSHAPAKVLGPPFGWSLHCKVFHSR